MAERFVYYLTHTNKVKIYRVAGTEIPQPGGLPSVFAIDFDSIASSYRYIVKYKCAIQDQSRLFATRADAEDAGTRTLQAYLNREIDRFKRYIDNHHTTLGSIKVDYHNCGGK